MKLRNKIDCKRFSWLKIVWIIIVSRMNNTFAVVCSTVDAFFAPNINIVAALYECVARAEEGPPLSGVAVGVGDGINRSTPFERFAPRSNYESALCICEDAVGQLTKFRIVLCLVEPRYCQTLWCSN